MDEIFLIFFQISIYADIKTPAEAAKVNRNASCSSYLDTHRLLLVNNQIKKIHFLLSKNRDYIVLCGHMSIFEIFVNIKKHKFLSLNMPLIIVIMSVFRYQ